jgi:predicted AAA+ superfamily ATPase
MFKRPFYKILLARLQEPRRYIQVLAGPRQVGKTTSIQQVIKNIGAPTLYMSADEAISHDHYWIQQQWDLARLEAKKNAANEVTILILDEVQKIPHWSDIVKKCWDEDTRQRASSPKLQVFNTALISACTQYSFHEAEQSREYWGRLSESTVGAYLLAQAFNYPMQIYYWRDGDKEVDFILQSGKKIVALEVKSHYNKGRHSGTEAFCQQFKVHRSLLVGGQGLPLETFLMHPIETWLE